MKNAVLILALFLAGCATSRKVSSNMEEVTIERDSIYISHIDTICIIKRDTVYRDRIIQSHDKVATIERKSYLENEYCTSSARIDTMGMLFHTLDTRDSAMLPRRIEYRTRYVSDTMYIAREDKHDKRTDKVQTVEVKHTTWWQKTQIIALWTLLGILAIKYRKQIYALIKKIILWI